jgi:hypothetical protein
MTNSDPANRADKVACGGCIDDTALGKPIGGRAAGVNSGGQSGSVVGKVGAWNDDDKDAQRIGPSEQLESIKGATQPRHGSGRRMGEAGSREGEINTMDRR